MTTALVVVTLIVALATLGVAIYEIKLLKSRWRREDEADIRIESIRLNENPAAPVGWQAFLDVRNVGGANAHDPEFWIGDRPDPEEVRRRAMGRGLTVASGESAGLGRDLEAVPNGERTVWLTWSDGRGPQLRDSGRTI